MKQTIEIEVPKGKKAVWKDNTIVFEDIKPQLPKTWKEFCEQNKIEKSEYYINDYCNITKSEVSNRHIFYSRNSLPNAQSAKAHLALMQLHQLRDYYRQGWIPDWKNNKYSKYCIECVNGSYNINAYYASINFLSFQSREIAEEFLNNFKDLIEQAGDLI